MSSQYRFRGCVNLRKKQGQHQRINDHLSRSAWTRMIGLRPAPATGHTRKNRSNRRNPKHWRPYNVTPAFHAGQLVQVDFADQGHGRCHLGHDHLLSPHQIPSISDRSGAGGVIHAGGDSVPDLNVPGLACRRARVRQPCRLRGPWGPVLTDHLADPPRFQIPIRSCKARIMIWFRRLHLGGAPQAQVEAALVLPQGKPRRAA